MLTTVLGTEKYYIAFFPPPSPEHVFGSLLLWWLFRSYNQQNWVPYFICPNFSWKSSFYFNASREIAFQPFLPITFHQSTAYWSICCAFWLSSWLPLEMLPLSQFDQCLLLPLFQLQHLVAPVILANSHLLQRILQYYHILILSPNSFSSYPTC